MSDARIIPFGRPPSDPINIEAFNQAANSATTASRVGEAVAEVCGIADFAIVDQIRVATSADDPGEQGTLMSQMIQDEVIVLASLPFARFLHNKRGVEANQAIDLAADMSQTIGLITRGIAGLPEEIPPAFGDSLQQAFWEIGFARQPNLNLPYRAAATVALHSQGLLPIGVLKQTNERFAPQISGLSNPLNRNEILGLKKFFRAGA